MKSPTPKRIWAEIQADYQAGLGNCRELTERYGISAMAIQNRCKRENWRKELAKYGELVDRKVDQRIDQLANKRAETLAEKAERFVTRTVDESIDWLDEVQKAKVKLAEGDTAGLTALVRAWEVPIRVGRTALRLDEKQAPSSVGINVSMLAVGLPAPRQPQPGDEVIQVAYTANGMELRPEMEASPTTRKDQSLDVEAVECVATQPRVSDAEE